MLNILRDLVRFRSITPNGKAAIEYCANLLRDWGFKVFIYEEPFINNIDYIQESIVTNMYAKLDCGGRKNFCFAGHVDVVPPGGNWTYEPWELTERNGFLYGRGVADMKGPLAAALAAIREFIGFNKSLNLSVALTSDEEVMTNGGMAALVSKINEPIDYCVLAESCSPKVAGEYIKIGCKGSLNIDLTYKTRQHHVAEAENGLHYFINNLNRFLNVQLDSGSDLFEPSRIQLTSIDVGNSVRNLIPSEISAKLNIRFNDLWTHDSLCRYIRGILPADIEIEFCSFGYPFIGASSNFYNKLKRIMGIELGVDIDIGTYGGNSDALSLHKVTEVVEIGSLLSQAHVVDERISIEDLKKLKRIYLSILCGMVDDDGLEPPTPSV